MVIYMVGNEKTFCQRLTVQTRSRDVRDFSPRSRLFLVTAFFKRCIPEIVFPTR
jgi:hypothetical protein